MLLEYTSYPYTYGGGRHLVSCRERMNEGTMDDRKQNPGRRRDLRLKMITRRRSKSRRESKCLFCTRISYYREQRGPGIWEMFSLQNAQPSCQTSLRQLQDSYLVGQAQDRQNGERVRTEVRSSISKSNQSTGAALASGPRVHVRYHTYIHLPPGHPE